jgi:death-on-curing protein
VSGTDIVWLLREVVEAIHDEQIAWHGGSEGTRDAGLLASALDRPRNLAAYGDPDLASLAASLGYGLARNHLFVDGNKRTAFVSVETFLLLNGVALVAADAECVLTMEGLAGGTISEADFATWIRRNLRPAQP